MRRDEDDELQIDMLLNENYCIRVRLYSKYRNATKHQDLLGTVTNKVFLKKIIRI